MTIGERIKMARNRAGLTQKELGERMGVSGTMIAMYETDSRNPKVETIRKIAEALDIPTFELNTGLRFGSELEKIFYEISEEKQISLDFVIDVFLSFDVHDPKYGILDNKFDLTKENILQIVEMELSEVNDNRKLIDNYNKLNGVGKKEAIKRIEELTYIDKYTK